MNTITKRIIYLIISLLFLYLQLTGFFGNQFNNISSFFESRSEGGILVSMILVLPSMIIGPIGFLFFFILCFKKEKKATIIPVTQEQQLNVEHVQRAQLDSGLPPQSNPSTTENTDLLSTNNVGVNDVPHVKRKGVSAGKILLILIAVYCLPLFIQFSKGFLKMSGDERHMTIFLVLGFAFMAFMIFVVPVLITGSAVALVASFKKKK
jgi:hypothetical protein